MMRVSLREIDHDDVRILPDTIEHDRFPVRHDVKCLYPGAIAEMGELTCGFRRQVEQPEVRCCIGRPKNETLRPLIEIK
jgi:hypothetical protein